MMDELFVKEPLSIYVIEVRFSGNFSVDKSNISNVVLWERTPIGLALVWHCPFCGAMIDHVQLGGPTQRIICSECFGVTTGSNLTEGVHYKLPVQGFVRPLAKLVRTLRLNTDIILIRMKQGITLGTADEVARVTPGRGELLLETAREDEKAIYTRKALEKDVASGASLEDRLKAFLLA